MTARTGVVVRRWNPGDDPSVLRAALASGEVIVFPTESSYGLGVDPRSRTGVEAVCRLKGRPAGKALPVVGADLSALGELGVDLEAPVIAWAKERWPAPLTVVAPLAKPIAASGGTATLAVRIPDREDLRELLDLLGGALTATSANPSGEEPYQDPTALVAWLGQGQVPATVVGKEVAPGGEPSTLVAWAAGRPRVLRPGRYPIA